MCVSFERGPVSQRLEEIGANIGDIRNGRSPLEVYTVIAEGVDADVLEF